jgi:GNAT superfamily N-acetyltransferase
MKASVAILSIDHWQRLKDIRLRALKSNPEAFGPKYEEELAHDETIWRKRFIKEDYLLASINQIDVGMLYIEVLKGDHGATCWIGGCWTDPSYRGQGVMKALFSFIDENCESKGWQRQGLGVWTHNLEAIKTYEALGFLVAGEKIPSKNFLRYLRIYDYLVGSAINCVK